MLRRSRPTPRYGPTDGAIKQRYIAVPAGQSFVYDDTTDTYGYPDHAVVMKNFSVDTIPGNPASRILFETRFSGREPGAERMAMPPLGSFEPDTNAINMISQWIVSLNPSASIHGLPAGALRPILYAVHGRVLENASATAQAENPALVDLSGVRLPLVRIRAGLYRIDGPMPSGIRFLIVGGKVAQSIVF